MPHKHKLQELIDKLQKLKDKRLAQLTEENKEFDDIILGMKSLFDPTSDDSGSNPPSGPGTPP